MRWWWIGLFVVALVAAGAFVVLWRSTVEQPAAVAPAAGAKTYARLSGDPLSGLDKVQRAALDAWLKANPLYEPIGADYCECADTFTEGQSPYAAAGDFNDDGKNDFAVLLQYEHGTTGPAFLVVFDGPKHSIAFTASAWMTRDALFTALGEDGVTKLLIGLPESDNAYRLTANGRGYELTYMGDGG